MIDRETKRNTRNGKKRNNDRIGRRTETCVEMKKKIQNVTELEKTGKNKYRSDMKRKSYKKRNSDK